MVEISICGLTSHAFWVIGKKNGIKFDLSWILSFIVQAQ